ncbi:MAG TPA: DUF6152 family protein [Steroidobacteraceae bacterium]|jgi:hypothetical protein|nr:DUF6152 family protein [Steroidobacteraceae bacterium]
MFTKTMRLGTLRNVALAAAAALCAAAVMPGYAHHSFGAEFDSNKPVTMTGVVTRLEWTNPHVYLFIDVKDKNGAVTNWGFEMGPPHMLQKAGWKRNSLTIGETVVIDGWLARDGSHHANARKVTRKSTGEVLGAATSGGQTLTGTPKSGGAAPVAVGSTQGKQTQ